MNELLDMLGLNIGVAHLNVTNDLY